MYHWQPHRIEAHVKICVLAWLIERLAEIKCNKPWSKISSILSKIQATEFETPGHVLFQLYELHQGAKTILEKLGITRPQKVFGIKNIKKDSEIV